MKALDFYIQNWKHGIHLIFRTYHFGVNNQWWSPFRSMFGLPWYKRFNVIQRFKEMKFRAKIGFVSADTYKKIFVCLLCLGLTSCQSVDPVTLHMLQQRIVDLEKIQPKNYCYVVITNPNGSRTSVRMKIEDGKYIGPSNEVYDRVPSPNDLAPYYGLAPRSENIRRTNER